jgi:MFS family permease
VEVIVGSLLLLGLGLGLFTAPTTSAILGSAPRERRGLASGIMSTARGLGMVVGFGLGGTVYTAVLGRIGLGATPASVTMAADATLLVAAVLAALAIVALTMRHSITSEISVANWTVRRLAGVAWSTRDVQHGGAR